MNYSGILNLPVSTFNLTEIKERVNNRVTFMEKHRCYIYMMYEPNSQTFMIISDNMDNLVQLTVNINVYTMSSIMLNENPMITNQTLFQNMIMFTCDKEDTCDEKFMYDYLEWVYRIKYNNFAEVIRPLIFTQNGNKGKNYKQVIFF